MEVTVELNKSVEENAATYFEKAKKAKRKLEGVRQIIEKTEKQLLSLEKKQQAQSSRKPLPKKEWYEKFRWMFTSEGTLVIGGRDATTNDIIVKKHLEETDLVFHADIAGSPFCVLKSKTPTKEEKEEVAVFCAINSKAFSLGLANQEVYAVSPSQVSLSAPAGEYMKKGSFMINGKKEYFQASLEFGAGQLPDGRIMVAPLPAAQKHCKDIIRLRPGERKKSDVVRLIQRYFKNSPFEITQEQVMSVLPPGNLSVMK